MTVKDRVREHRAKLQEQQRQRLEVCISIPLLDQVRHTTKKPLSHVVQDALAWYIEERRELVAEGGRLAVERERLEALVRQGDYPADFKDQVDDYNRQNTAFNTGAGRFSRPPFA
jgi:hypothetical protein